jgi:hypothetical protein
MRRRNFVRTLVAAATAPRMLFSQQQAKQPLPAAAPVPWFTGLNPRTPLPHTEPATAVATPELRFFSPLQMQTLSRLAAAFMPPLNGKPGAVEAQTPEFLDFLLSTSPQDRQKLYTGGLDWLESESQRKFKSPFAKLTDDQAGQLLQPWLRTWMSDHPPTEPHADFVNIAHDEIRAATINSRAWNATPFTGIQQHGEEGLYWTPIEPELAYEPPHVAAQPRIPNSMPTYKR